MQVYAVGGCVRDGLLGRPVADRDWVVVGATPEQMIAAGYRPVGRDFPVFLHPATHEEYALARTERKVAPGYHGFAFHAAPTVTLEEDLARRDLTINAMALDAEGRLIDPHGGQADLRNRVLRHVGPAFVEDPVRILRVARFAARLPGFRVAEETAALMRAMVAGGEADALVPERVVQELLRGLGEARPDRLLDVLEDCGLLARLYPELLHLPRARAALGRAPAALGPTARFALLALACEGSASAVRWATRLRAPAEAIDLARLLHELLDGLAAADAPAPQLALIEALDGLRRPERFATLLAAAACALPADEPLLERLARARAAAAAVDAGQLARAAAGPGPAIGERVRQARLAAIAALGATP